MARPQIEFIQSQVLPWQRGSLGNARNDVEYKTLSADPETGECSLVVRYSKGWRRRDERLAADEEFYVIEGAITVNGREYTRDCYGYFPAGYHRREAEVADSAVVLTFYEGHPSVIEAGKAISVDEQLLVEFKNALEMKWETVGIDPAISHLGPSLKRLWLNPRNKDETYLFAYTPHSHPKGWKGKQSYHPVSEESFMLVGESSGNIGVRRAGGYYYRPAWIPHGPFGSEGGAVGFFRIRGGTELVNHWTEEAIPFTYNAPYRPILPPDMQRYATAEWDRRQRY